MPPWVRYLRDTVAKLDGSRLPVSAVNFGRFVVWILPSWDCGVGSGARGDAYAGQLAAWDGGT
jgi:hypothetical protein